MGNGNGQKCSKRSVMVMDDKKRLKELLARLSRKYVDGKVIYWEFESVARRELDIGHDEFYGLVEELVKEGEIEAIVTKNMADLYFKPKGRDGRE